jgi:hypothetical protein
MPPRPGNFTSGGASLKPAFRTSSPVSTAFTPGEASAAFTSSETISACARSARRKWP